MPCPSLTNTGPWRAESRSGQPAGLRAGIPSTSQPRPPRPPAGTRQRLQPGSATAAASGAPHPLLRHRAGSVRRPLPGFPRSRRGRRARGAGQGSAAPASAPRLSTLRPTDTAPRDRATRPLLTGSARSRCRSRSRSRCRCRGRCGSGSLGAGAGAAGGGRGRRKGKGKAAGRWRPSARPRR